MKALLNSLPRFLLAAACVWSFSHHTQAQKVGVVLSGGGATALSHVGFLRALEENGIPIDYIGGTSMGAVIAAFYASGYTVEQIDSLARSREFYLMSQGELEDQWKFYYLTAAKDASLATIKYRKGELMTQALPTNLIDPVLMDWKFLEAYSQADATAGYDFDSLYIPFRCIAADVEKKKEVIFRSGALNIAVRASSTYPFYLPPRRVNGSLLYDGGIYNNYPVDIMYQEFLPDVIIGCNVSDDQVKADEENLFSQLQTMILFREPPQSLCAEMIMVDPSASNVGTFDFNKVGEAIDLGYKATIDSIPAILQMVDRRVSVDERMAKRKAFRDKFHPFVVEEIQINGLDRAQKSYVTKMVGRRPTDIPIEKLKQPYFRIFADDKIKSIFPLAHFNDSTGKYSLLLDVQREKDLFVSFGGNFSSRSINTGFVGLRYNLFGKTSATLNANSYFGRFYASIFGGIRWDISSRWLPFSVEASYTQNRWDFYKSLSTFFEDVKPSFVLLNERMGNLAASIPAGNKGLVRFDATYGYLFDQYYQTTQFLSVDTADRTDFSTGIGRLTWERNTLNRKQYASKGTYLIVSGKYVFGRESTIPGTTSEIKDTTYAYHSWFQGKVKYTNYFFRRGKFHTGLILEGVVSTQDFFRNYISSVIISPAFQPIPESSTYFLPQFRAHNYAAGGLAGIFELGKNVDIRAEAYVFNAFGRIVPSTDNLPTYDFRLRQYFIGSSSIIYHSPVGPISLSANYYQGNEKPWSILFNLGYIIFNRSARD